MTGNVTNVLEIAVKGGFLMLILLVISVIAIAIIIERLISLRRLSGNNKKVMAGTLEHLGAGIPERAVALCEENASAPISTILIEAIDNLKAPWHELETILELEANRQGIRLQKNLGTLSTFAAVAPLIGFLGTVTGMVKVFMKIGETSGGVDISLLANGIWEALITTIGGLTVGIISILFYNYLIGRTETIASELEDGTSRLLIHIRRLRDED
ncbi:MAG: MotA/TolQ/ExbB proton channel family protein [Candidatus Cloacimonetes bacterium]|nr:MotA/TolQ/ExbB proton channel family protein [Candidatus Cloacimonadota bacterium]